MNWVGSGFIPIIIYGTTSNLSVVGAILTESGNELLAEDANYLQIESV